MEAIETRFLRPEGKLRQVWKPDWGTNQKIQPGPKQEKNKKSSLRVGTNGFLIDSGVESSLQPVSGIRGAVVTPGAFGLALSFLWFSFKAPGLKGTVGAIVSPSFPDGTTNS